MPYEELVVLKAFVNVSIKFVAAKLTGDSSAWCVDCISEAPDTLQQHSQFTTWYDVLLKYDLN